MKNSFLIIILLTLLSSCFEDKSCSADYTGTFTIDTSLIENNLQREWIKKYRWTSVKLISDANGQYQFDTKDKILANAEGYWYTKSNNLEGECAGYIKQRNLQIAFIRVPFDIMIGIDDTTGFNLPFRRNRQ